MEIVGRLSSAVIHDLNNLLTVIQLNSALIEAGGLSEAEISGGAEQIGLACKQASHLTRKVLNLARRRAEEDRPVAIDVLVADLGRLFEAFVAKKAAVRVEKTAGPLWVHGNAGEIEQMLMNLVLNAIDAMPNGGEVVIGCGAVASGDTEMVELRVSDEGEGISPEVQARILEPFFTTKEIEGGTGMGLYIVDQIVRRHGGSIQFLAAPVRGTIVRVLLPGSTRPTESPRPPEVARPPVAETRTILLVEDDPGILQLTRFLLARAGYRVLEAETGEAALKLWAEHRDEVRLVLTDLVLPGELSGRDIVLTVLAQKPGLPVLYTSGYAAAWDDQAFFNEAHFIPKPFHPDALLAKVAEALGAGVG
jgi:CheY-like chemotaxis protein